MAQFAYHQHEYKLVVRLLKDFHSRFPDANNITDAYILLARTLANGLRLKDKAQAYLRFLIQQFPDYPSIDALREMEQTIARGGRI
jgi:TolA-binding protein